MANPVADEWVTVADDEWVDEPAGPNYQKFAERHGVPPEMAQRFAEEAGAIDAQRDHVGRDLALAAVGGIGGKLALGAGRLLTKLPVKALAHAGLTLATSGPRMRAAKKAFDTIRGAANTAPAPVKVPPPTVPGTGTGATLSAPIVEGGWSLPRPTPRPTAPPPRPTGTGTGTTLAAPTVQGGWSLPPKLPTPSAPDVSKVVESMARPVRGLLNPAREAIRLPAGPDPSFVRGIPAEYGSRVTDLPPMFGPEDIRPVAAALRAKLGSAKAGQVLYGNTLKAAERGAMVKKFTPEMTSTLPQAARDAIAGRLEGMTPAEAIAYAGKARNAPAAEHFGSLIKAALAGRIGK